MNKQAILKLLEESAPIAIPVSSEFTGDFFTVLFRYLDEDVVLRVIYGWLGPDLTIKFLSRFHGMTIPVKPKKYWEDKFRDVHCYLVLRGISRVNDPEKWRHTVIRLARVYQMTEKNVLSVFKKVQVSARKL